MVGTPLANGGLICFKYAQDVEACAILIMFTWECRIADYSDYVHRLGLTLVLTILYDPYLTSKLNILRILKRGI